MIIAAHIDGRLLSYDENAYEFSLAGLPISLAELRSMDDQGAITWNMEEQHAWFRDLDEKAFQHAHELTYKSFSGYAPTLKREEATQDKPVAPKAQATPQTPQQPAPQPQAYAGQPQWDSAPQSPYGNYAPSLRRRPRTARPRRCSSYWVSSSPCSSFCAAAVLA